MSDKKKTDPTFFLNSMADAFNSNHEFECGKLEPDQRRGMLFFLIKYYAENGIGFVVSAENRQHFIRKRSKVRQQSFFMGFIFSVF